MTSMSLLVAVAVALASLSSTIVAGGNCPGAHRNLTMGTACSEATSTAGEPIAMYDLCMDTLGRRNRAGSIHEASEYAFIAAFLAWNDYQSTMSWLRDTLGNASIPGEVQEAYRKCGRGYLEAEAGMVGVWTQLPEHCSLDLGDEYRAALRELGTGMDGLAKLPDSQLLGMVEADYDRTKVAYMLGKFIGIK